VAAGMAAGVAFLLHPKGALILLACAVFAPGEWLRLGAGFLIPNAVAVGWLVMQGAWSDYVAQVWRWGWLYASSPAEPARDALLRLAGWIGFHAALVIGVARRWPGWRWILWCGIGLAGASLGGSFAPRYLNVLLVPLVILGAAGLADRSLRLRLGIVVAFALIIPAVRFGPRYFSLGAEDLAGTPRTWADVHMDLESRAASAVIRSIQRPGNTIFIWGYRPNVVVYTRLPVAGRFWDSQAVTGVPADRHLGSATPLDAAWAARNRAELVRTSPAILVDGLSAYNPALDVRKFPDLAEWFARYCQASTLEGMKVYRLCSGR